MTRMWRASMVSLVLALLGRQAYAPYFVLRDDFDRFDSNRWVVAKWRAPGNSHLNGSHFLASHAWTENGCLVLRLQQTDDRGVMGRVRSYGAEVASRERYGFGTYEWRARVGSTASTPFGHGEQVSGGVTGLFNYEAPGGALRTEIDIEVEGVRPDVMHATAWTSASKSTSAAPVDGMEQRFRHYKFVWHPNRVEYFVDGVLRSTHTAVVPQDPAFVIMNHWGTNDEDFGGGATTDVARFLYVDWFQFTPANNP